MLTSEPVQTGASGSLDLAVRAMQLLGRWNRFAGAWKPFAPGCSCCLDAGPQSAEDLELTLMYHLADLHTGDPIFAAALEEGAGYRTGERGSVVSLLQAIARRSMAASASVQGTLLDDIDAALGIAEANQAPRPSD